MKRFLRSYFTFTRGERNGLIVLLTLVLLLLAVRMSLPYLIIQKPIDFTEFERQMIAFESSLMINDTNKIEAWEATIDRGENDSMTLFYFDPNKLHPSDWRRLGLNDRQVKTIKNYLAKGGKFYKKEDLKKIYGLHKQDYERLKEYVRIEDDHEKKLVSNGNSGNEHSTCENKGKREIELNSADSATLLQLKGIGPVFAGRIIRYRDILGGYFRKDQLLEVYGFAPEKLEDIGNDIIIDQSKITKIPLNTAKYSGFIKHPYLNNYNTGAILAYRKQVVEVKDLNELINNKVISKEIFEKIQPYLSLE